MVFAFFFVSCGSDGNVTRWQVSGVNTVGEDQCDFLSSNDTFSGSTFVITIDDNVVTMEHEDLELRFVSDAFSDQDNIVNLDGESDTPVSGTSCVVHYDENVILTVGDENRRLENNSSLTVGWTHTESESSAQDTCDGQWFVDLPCTSTLAFTLTKVE